MAKRRMESGLRWVHMQSRRVVVVLGRLFWCFKSIGAFATINRSINTFTVVAACVGTDVRPIAFVALGLPSI